MTQFGMSVALMNDMTSTKLMMAAELQLFDTRHLADDVAKNLKTLRTSAERCRRTCEEHRRFVNSLGWCLASKHVLAGTEQ